MFGFLKDKLKGAVDKISKKAEEEAKEETVEVPEKAVGEESVESTPQESAEEAVIEKVVSEPEETIGEEPAEKEPQDGEPDEETAEQDDEEEPEKKGILRRITETVTTVTLTQEKFEELFYDLEIALLQNNAAMEVVEKIKEDLRDDLVDKKIPRRQLEEKILASLEDSLADLFRQEQTDFIDQVTSKKPYVIAMIGINGSGKTTSLAKLVHFFQQHDLEPVVAACDTFRAAAIQQLQEHTDRLGVKLIKHDYGSDPAAVAYDAVAHAKAKNKDIVLIDTAGRLHSNENLMQELEKVIRVSKPDMKIFVGESIAGNDVVEQVRLFNNKVGIDGIILSKADTDEKGGAAISVSYITKKPILFLGTGQEYEDLMPFDADTMIQNLSLS